MRKFAAAALATLAIAFAIPPTPAHSVVLSTLHVSLSRIASGLSSPVAMGVPSDGRMFFVEQGGRVKVRQSSGSIGTYLDISSEVLSGGERGLLGIAFHPHFSSNGYVFLYYTDSNGALNIARFQASPPSANSVSASTQRTIITIPHTEAANHNGGQLAFGPDGYLYTGTGDGGNSWDDPVPDAHDTTHLLGKILRLDVDHACNGKNYCIPSGNPYGNEVWEYGLRNPWRFSFDRSDHSLWIGDVGQNSWEEIDHTGAGVGGRNFGWDCWEGTHPAKDNGASYCTPLSATTQPVAQYDHNSGDCAVIGGFVYRGSRYAANMGGVYLYGDYCTGTVRAYSNGSQRVVDASGLSLTSFGQDNAGELYATAANGSVYHVTASGGTNPPPPPAPSHTSSAPKPTPSRAPTPTPTASRSSATPSPSVTPSPTPTVLALARPGSGGSPWPWIGLGLGLSALLGAGALVVRRRFRATG